MRYPKNDGTTFGGVVLVACVVIAFCAGYTLRDNGITFKVNIPQETRK